MAFVIAALVLIGLPAVLATVFSWGIAARFPARPRWQRIALAAVPAGLAPVTPGLISVWRAYRLTTLVPLGAVFTLGLIVALVVGVPAAWHATRTKA
ncbi:hypothetical protein [Novosphingobium olei]|uniref:Uncharacterized protein n=1 Tax=Novosphingobium olei TaxID=2728851 RepID=A0A7Y0G9H0_9SPHN|nr:hypothetical protein [Novosphingobium olei]NML92799.1 hypothetical protein [Novosphingobium olei]